jgi:hypothetical protein
VHWYVSDWPRTSDILSTTAMVPAPVLLTLLAMVLAALLAVMAAVWPRIWNNDLL